MLKNVTSEDSGTYECQARNAIAITPLSSSVIAVQPGKMANFQRSKVDHIVTKFKPQHYACQHSIVAGGHGCSSSKLETLITGTR